MGRKKNPGFYLYSDDIMSSKRCRALSRQAAGVYLFLLCRLSDPDSPGCYRLSQWDDDAKKRRSLTRRCLENPDKYARLQYFAEILSENDLPWNKKKVLASLRELYRRGIIIVEGDCLIQPRMYVDNGFEIPDFDNDGDPVGTILDDKTHGPMLVTDAAPAPRKRSNNNGENKGADNGTETGTKKVQKNPRVGAGDAPAQSKRVGVGDNNNKDNSKGNIGGVGVKTSDKPKTQEKSPIIENGASEGEKKSGTGNLSSDTQKHADSPKNGSDGQKIPVADQPPTLREIQDYMQQRGEGGDPFRHITAEQFYDEGCMSGWTIRGGQPLYSWQARLRSLEGYRRKNGEPTVTEEGYVAYRDGKLLGTLAVRQQPQGGQQGRVQTQPKPGDPVSATPTAKGKYKNKW